MLIVILSIFICLCKNIDQIMISFTSYNFRIKHSSTFINQIRLNDESTYQFFLPIIKHIFDLKTYVSTHLVKKE